MIVDKEDFILNIENLKIIMKNAAPLKGNILSEIDLLKSLNEKYVKLYEEINKTFHNANLENPNKYNMLWDWYFKWKIDDLKKDGSQTDAEKLAEIDEMYGPTLILLQQN